MNDLISQIEKTFPDVKTDTLIDRVQRCGEYQVIKDEYQELRRSMKATEAMHHLSAKHFKSYHTIERIIYVK